MKLRIVGGALSGRFFDGPSGSGTRPTSERVREAIANALAARDGIAGKRVLELFAGTGALSFELLSRGASHAVLAERDARACKSIRTSAQALGLAARVVVTQLDLLDPPPRLVAQKLARHAPYDLVLCDAPYADIARIPPLLAALGRHLREGDARLVIEHDKRGFPALGDGFEVEAEYRYGDTGVVFASLSAPSPPGEQPEHPEHDSTTEP